MFERWSRAVLKFLFFYTYKFWRQNQKWQNMVPHSIFPLFLGHWFGGWVRLRYRECCGHHHRWWFLYHWLDSRSNAGWGALHHALHCQQLGLNFWGLVLHKCLPNNLKHNNKLETYQHFKILFKATVILSVSKFFLQIKANIHKKTYPVAQLVV